MFFGWFLHAGSQATNTRTDIVCEDECLQLSCPSGQFIHIEYANYGRTAPYSEVNAHHVNWNNQFAWMHLNWSNNASSWRIDNCFACIYRCATVTLEMKTQNAEAVIPRWKLSGDWLCSFPLRDWRKKLLFRSSPCRKLFSAVQVDPVSVLTCPCVELRKENKLQHAW